MLFNSNNQKDKMPLVAADVGCWKLNCVVLDPGYTAGEQGTLELSTSLPKFHNDGEGRRALLGPSPG